MNVTTMKNKHNHKPEFNMSHKDKTQNQTKTSKINIIWKYHVPTRPCPGKIVH